MSIRLKIFLGILAVVSVGFYFFVDWIVDDLNPQYRKSTEEPLVDMSRVLASIAAFTADEQGQLDIPLFRKSFQDVSTREFIAQIYDFQKTSVDLRVYLTDENGIVLFDSEGGRSEGEDFSSWRDVRLSLEGQYGARTSRDTLKGPYYSLMYVASPIIIDDEIVGVLTVGKPTENANSFVAEAEDKVILGSIISGLAIILVVIMISGMVTRPIYALTKYATDIRDGKRASLPRLSGDEMKQLGEAFEEMRQALEGKNYVEKYVQTLTHEFKSPLAAIKGASELLNEEMALAERKKFLENIKGETERLEELVQKLLLLSRLETRTELVETEEIQCSELIEDVVSSLKPLADNRGITIELNVSETSFTGERFLIRQALSNLLQNAIEFSPETGTIVVRVKEYNGGVSFSIIDQGNGIPEYAKQKVFERFYSLKRPATGRKSTGLGLSLVKEVAELHGGEVKLESSNGGGTEARFLIPRNIYDLPQVEK